MSGDTKDLGFIIYWCCDEHRVPLKVTKIGGAGDGWHVFGGGYEILTLIPILNGAIYYKGNDFDFEDILALVDVITQETGITYTDVFMKADSYPSGICRLPPYFEPIFRSKREEARFYRQKWLQAKKELDRQSERELKVIWRG